MKVIDCFPFFDEFLILDVRFRELYDLVDKFVIVECEETFTGIPKPLHLSEHLHQRYPQYADKVEIITVPQAEFANQWDREYFQKNHICKDNIKHLGLDDGDLILLSDADEIPRRSVVESLKNGFNEFGGAFHYKTYYYKFNILTTEMCWRSKYISYKHFTNHTEVRFIDHELIPDAGWHFSYIKTPENIKKKIEAFSHQEFNFDSITNLDNIASSIEARTDLFRRQGMDLVVVPVDDTYPEYIKENLDKLTEWIA